MNKLDTRIEPDHPITVPEAARLWREVLEQAVRDAIDPRDTDRDDDLTTAPQWFSMKSDHFIVVCENAGFDPEVFLEQYRRKYLTRTPR